MEQQPRMLARAGNQLPGYTVDSETFWKGGARGQLLINRCADCSKYHHPPAPICYHCLSTDVAPTPVSGKGTIVSFTINYQPWLPEMVVPFAAAFIAIEEQEDVWLLSNIVGCQKEDVAIGAAVKVLFEQQEEVWIPLFELDREA